MLRSSGIVMPISALPGPFGIGCLGEEAIAFAKKIRDAGFSYWQILPFGPTGSGDSPYQSFSTFAGNAYFIDLRPLHAAGWLSDDELSMAEHEFLEEVDGNLPVSYTHLDVYKRQLWFIDDHRQELATGDDHGQDHRQHGDHDISCQFIFQLHDYSPIIKWCSKWCVV